MASPPSKQVVPIILSIISLVGCSSTQDVSVDLRGMDSADMRTYEAPRVRSKVKPTVPHGSLPQGVTKIKAFVDTDGIVRETSVHESSGDPILDLAAKRAAAEWTFWPAKRNGLRTPEYVIIRFEFGPETKVEAQPDSSAIVSEPIEIPTAKAKVAIDEPTVDTPPELIRAVQPEYPRSQGSPEGITLVELLINKEGSVEEVHVVQSSGDSRLDKAAKDAARQWRFRPAQQNGIPVSAKIVIPFEFTLK